jgi:DNA-binding response OmpR family regulator
MGQSYILLVDNDPVFLAFCSELLESANYKVFTATGESEARRILKEKYFHLVILDMRLIDDTDEKDKGGLDLAKEITPSVPKLILTKFPEYHDVREAMRWKPKSLPPAVDFLDKKDGIKRLIEVVEQIFSEHVRINHKLHIHLSEANPVTFLHLVNLIAPEFEGEQLLNGAEELEDLFRILFVKEDQIRIDRLLWQRNRNAAVAVFAFSEGGTSESMIVVCGEAEAIQEERRRYETFAPKAPGQPSTVLRPSSETMHFAANAYALGGADLENIRSLSEAYYRGPEKGFLLNLNTLFEKTLPEWHQGNRVLEESEPLVHIYGQKVGITEARLPARVLRERLQSIIRILPTVGLKVESDSGKLRFHFNDQVFSYADPGLMIHQAFESREPVLLVNAPGMLTGENILADSNSQVWVTDFADAGLEPQMWSYISLESAIRFDWVETTNLRWIQYMEESLVFGGFGKPFADDLEAPLSKAVRSIQRIRQFASRAGDNDPLMYHLGIMYQALKRLAEFDPTIRSKPGDLARAAHTLMTAAMISELVIQSKQLLASSGHGKEVGIRIDKANRMVWVDGKKIELTGNSYDLLCDLYDHPNQLRTRRELIEQVFGLRYEETDRSQMSRLNTAINRLRKIIRDDAEKPRFLFTKPGGGYRLNPKPEE